MTFADSEKLLDEYIAWRAQKPLEAKDLSGSAFLVDRAKETAMTRVNDAVELIERYWTPEELGADVRVSEVKKILSGE